MERIKGSRFICDLAPARDVATALASVDQIRRAEPGATHHCWAFRLDSGESRSSDDGEPRGTAGPPILRRLEAADLVDVVAVVTRYYGGTNLGTGGLIRAYGSATAAAIDAAETLPRRRMVDFLLDHPYELSGAIARVLAATQAEVVTSRFDASVSIEVAVPLESANVFLEAVREATAGEVTARRADALPQDNHLP